MTQSALILQRAYRCVLFKMRLQKNKTPKKENKCIINRAALRTWTRHHCEREDAALSTVCHFDLKMSNEETCSNFHASPRHSRTSTTIQSLLSEFSSQVSQAKPPRVHCS